MTTPAPWTIDSLERACRKALLERASLRLRRLPISRSAEVHWAEPNGHAKIVVDDGQVGVLAGAVHELLHVVMNGDLSSFGEDVQEEIVAALEESLVGRISRSRRRLAWWRKALKGKLPK